MLMFVAALFQISILQVVKASVYPIVDGTQAVKSLIIKIYFLFLNQFKVKYKTHKT